MKAQIMMKIGKWIGCGALLSGLAYSVLALTVSVRPTYASSCNCDDEVLAAAEFCGQYDEALIGFVCPYGTHENEFEVTCQNVGTFILPCSD
jgi:hypothetical protein